jgi:hypothetical protein
MSFFLYQLGAFAGWFIYGSFFEWTFHKYLFHSPKFIRATYEAHAIVHHQTYKGDDTYDLPSPKDPDGKHIMMDWFALPLFVGVHILPIWAVQKLTGIPMLWGGLSAIAVYYLGYETLHYFMHVPRDRWIERTRVFKFLNEHHRIHHKYPNKNLNVLVPFADTCLRTLKTAGRSKQAAPAPQAPDPGRPAPRVAKDRQTQE